MRNSPTPWGTGEGNETTRREVIGAVAVGGTKIAVGMVDDTGRGPMMSFADRKPACAGGFNLPTHRFEVVLHAVDADGQAVLHQPPFT